MAKRAQLVAATASHARADRGTTATPSNTGADGAVMAPAVSEARRIGSASGGAASDARSDHDLTASEAARLGSKAGAASETRSDRGQNAAGRASAAAAILRAVAGVAVVVVVWAAASAVARSALFPGPLEVARSLGASARGGTLGRAIAVSALRLVFGYGLALLAGVPLGVLLARVPPLKRALGPLLLGLSSVPSICWLPLAIVWFGLSEAAIQVVVILGAALPITLATESSVRQLPPSIERAARTMGARGATLLFRVLVAAALPGILTGAKMGWTFALRSLMAGELLFVSGGLGQLLETGRDLADTALVLGVVVVIIALSQASERLLFGPVERLVARRWGTAAP